MRAETGRRILERANTTKFGDLSVPHGRVEIAWTIGRESQRSLGQQLNGEVQLAYQLTGFIYALDVPVTSLTVKA
jgi:hypothetical protein